MLKDNKFKMHGIRYLLVLLLMSTSLSVFSTHIVGGSLTYVYNGGSSYTITLKLYRDCGANTATLPNSAVISIRGNNGETFSISKDITMPLVSITPVPSGLDPCAVAPNPMPCVEQGLYTLTVNNLPPNFGGYHLYYQLVARNLSIVNVNAACNCVGESFYAYIPDATDFWVEKFNFANGTAVDNGATAWSVLNGIPPVNSANVNGNMFQFAGANNGVATWSSGVINIAAFPTGVNLSADLGEVGTFENSDTIFVYYSLNGGPLVLFSVNGTTVDDFGVLTATQSGVIGSTVQIFINVHYGGSSPNSELYNIDNVYVYGNNTVTNSNPVFNQYPPLFLCVGEPFVFDHSATDIDGDSLYYEFYTPYNGDNGVGPLDPTFPANTATFTPIIFQPGFSFLNPLGGTPLNLNSSTGLLSGTPNMLGQFVFGVVVKEYRNGVYLDKTLRDYQINVVNCPQPNPPIVGSDITINDGCTDTLNATGFIPATVTWTSVYPGLPGTYNNYMSCTSGCLNPIVTSQGPPPAYVDYMICGNAASCNNAFVCDTVRVTFNPTLHVTIQPIIPTICFGQTSTTITAYGSGGTPPYSYLWNNINPSQSNVVGAGTFTVMLTDSSGCPPAFTTVTVTAYANPITANAGADDTLCVQTPLVTLNGSVIGCSGGIWSGGGGTFSPNNTTLTGVNYMPTASELAAGFVNIILTTTGNGNCPGGVDTVKIKFLGFIGNETIIPTMVSCFGGNNGSATVNITNGIPPYTYFWNTVPSQTSATASNLAIGTYTVSLQNGIGCTKQDTVTITQPQPLVINTSSTPVSCNGGNNGTATASPLGGTAPYNYLWSPGGNTTSIVNGLIAGTYTVTVKDTHNCITTNSVVVSQPTPLAVSFTHTNVSCFGGSDATASSTVTGGIAPYTYSWSPSGGTSPNATGLHVGTYTLTVTDFKGCTKIASVVITQPLLPVSASSTVTNVSCFGGTNGSIAITPTGGTSPYTYLWTSGDTSTVLSGQQAGTYTVTVKDIKNCTFTTFATIIQPTKLIVNTNHTNVSCFGGSNGLASVSASGGTPGYQYLWTPGGATTSSITNIPKGTYFVTVTDTKGCIVNDSVVITEPLLPLSQNLTSVPTLCKGSANGKVSTLATGGTSPYTYLWLSGGQTTTLVTGLLAGTYSVTTTDSKGCTVTNSIVVNEPLPLTVNFTQTNVSCFGGSNGTASAIVSGGILPYSYNWSPFGGSSSNASGLSFGTYVLTTTDSNLCTHRDSVIITQPSLPLNATTSVINTSCNGGNDGSISITPLGGTLPYSYSWLPGGQTTATISGQLAGTYTVTVTDLNGCTYIKSLTILEPTPPIINFTFSSNVSCNGGNDGSITATPSGGTPNYTYLWSPGGATTSTISGLIAGTYSLTVMDSKNCQVQNSIIITEPTLLTSNVTSIPTVCNSSGDGTATVVVMGGTSPYTYLWLLGGQTTSTVSGLVAGTYYVITTDSKGCAISDSVIVNEPDSIVLLVVEKNSDCGNPNGEAYVSVVSGGIAPFTYLWSPNGSSNDSISGLLSAVYTVIVTDSTGCSATSVANVNDNAAAVPTIISITNVSCNGGANGSATVSLAGGIGPFTYLWSPSGDTNATATGLSAGMHSVVITGSNGCQSNITTSPNITEPAPIYSYLFTFGVSCYGDSNGSAIASSYGGSPGYTYQWLPGGTIGNSVNNLPAGTDSVVTTDAHGCKIVNNFTISQPTQLSVMLTTTPVLCFGGSTGSASASASGGTPPYNYNWIPGNFSEQNISALPIGSYLVTVSDAKGCTVLDSITVTQPTPIILTASSINSTCGFSNGLVYASVSGGIPGYSYEWLPIGGTDSVSIGLPSGLYTVSVNDTNGCSKTVNVTVINTPGPTATVTSTTNVSCSGGANGTATVSVLGGTSPFNYVWSPIGGTSPTGTGFSIGTYSVVVTDSNGCQANATSPIITQPNPLVTSTLTTNVSCFGGTNGTAIASSVGGTPGYSYQWFPSGSSGISITTLSAGLDSVITTDTLGCKMTKIFLITEPTVLSASVSSINNVNCFGGNDGSATIVPTGGTPFYTYSWSPFGGSNPTGVGLTVGNYVATVTDIKGCSFNVNIPISEPFQALTATGTVAPNSCFGSSNGSATINPIGGTPNYSYLWSPFEGTNQTENGLSTGTYTVLVSDTNGCQTNIAVSILQPTALNGTLSFINPSCGFSNGSIFSMVAGGIPPFSYLWSLGGLTSSNINNLSPGLYSVEVQDSLGCILTLSTNITNIAGPTVSAATIANVSCFGGNDGSALVNISGGSSPFTMNWSPFGGINDTASVLTIGTFTVLVTDSLGCLASDSTVITQPEPVSIAVSSVTNVSCNGGNNGEIIINGSGGTGTFNYSWTPNSSNSAVASNLDSGIYIVTLNDQNSCSTSVSIIVTEPTALNSAIGTVTMPTCFTSTNGTADVVVNGGTAPYVYLWSDGQTGSNASNLIGGNYSVTITDTNGCIISNNVVIIQPASIITIAGVNDTICLGQSGVVSATAIGGVGNYNFAWQPVGESNSGSLIINPTVDSEYYVMAFDVNGCPGSIDTVYAIILSLDSSNIKASVTIPSICLGQNTQVSVQQMDVIDVLTFSWNNGLGNGSGPFTVSPSQQTSYIVTATNTCGVSVKDTVDVNITPPPTLLMTLDNDSACNFMDVQFIDNSVSSNPADQIHYWLWNFGDGTTSQLQDPIHTYNQPGVYQVILSVTTGNGCTTDNSSPPITVQVFPVPSASFSTNSTNFYLPTETLITTNTSQGAIHYNWNFGDGATSTVVSPEYLYSTIGFYQIQLIATNQYGCSDIATKDIITSADLVVPNAFTPKSGGSSGGFYDITSLDNDIFFPYTSGIVSFNFEIFNRWGELIFVTQDIKQGWDGYYKGELAQKGVYIWKIYAKLNNGKVFNKTGDVTLLK